MWPPPCGVWQETPPDLSDGCFWGHGGQNQKIDDLVEVSSVSWVLSFQAAFIGLINQRCEKLLVASGRERGKPRFERGAS